MNWPRPCWPGSSTWAAMRVSTEPTMFTMESLYTTTQILNHALYKAPLFILAGAIAHADAIRAEVLEASTDTDAVGDRDFARRLAAELHHYEDAA